MGAGDSLVAGFLYGYGLHGTLQGALQVGRRRGSGHRFPRDRLRGRGESAVSPGGKSQPHLKAAQNCRGLQRHFLPAAHFR